GRKCLFEITPRNKRVFTIFMIDIKNAPAANFSGSEKLMFRRGIPHFLATGRARAGAWPAVGQKQNRRLLAKWMSMKGKSEMRMVAGLSSGCVALVFALSLAAFAAKGAEAEGM